jgi:hypothetical protein
MDVFTELFTVAPRDAPLGEIAFTSAERLLAQR